MLRSPEEVKRLLEAMSAGDDSAVETLFPLVYEQLHRLASRYMRQERANHTLQPTALIHEAFLRMTKSIPAKNSDVPSVTSDLPGYEDLNHFVATAAVVMRRILVNYAKSSQAQKRGGGQNKLQLDDVADAFGASAIDLVALDEALKQLAVLDQTQHRLVELRFFGGMTIKQCADQLGISERAAYYEWSYARAWLRSQIESK